MSPARDEHRDLLEAVAFAARAHDGQRRKDGLTPYVSHAFRVCLVLRHVFAIDDPPALLTALLHDTIEDTTTDYDDLKEKFGAQVADGVRLLSKDKRLPEPEREQQYEMQLAAAPWRVQVGKLADIYDNLLDMPRIAPGHPNRAVANARRYLAALQRGLKPEARPAFDVVARLLAEVEASTQE